MVRVDQIEMVDQLVGKLATCAVYHLDAKAVDGTVGRNLEHRDGRLRELVVRRVGGQVERGEVDDECTAPQVGENPSAGGVAQWPGMGPVPGIEREEQSERQRAMGHGGEL